jgi:hypothetical protein
MHPTERESWMIVRVGLRPLSPICCTKGQVGRADLHAEARFEGQVDGVKMVWVPAGKEGV